MKRDRVSAEQFFYEHAAFSYDPKTETPVQGKERAAKEYARAEKLAWEEGIVFVWMADDEPVEIDGETLPAECCIAINEDTQDVLASLSGITGATKAYRRVVEAELALEALGTRNE